MKRLFAFVIVLIALQVLSASAEPLVYVSILPQLESVRVIGRGVCRAEALLRYGQNPETFQLNARMIEALRKSEAFIGIGLPFEALLVPRLRGICPELQFTDASLSMKIYGMEGGAARSRNSRSGCDPHVWLSVENMLIHSREVEKVLIGKFPGSRERIEKNAAEYISGLRSLKRSLESRLSACRGREVLVYHPAFGYFLREYGIIQLAVEKDGKTPGGRYLDQLTRKIQSSGISTLFYQPQFSDRMPRNLSRRLHLKLMTLDPLPEQYSDGLRQMADRVAQACGTR